MRTVGIPRGWLGALALASCSLLVDSSDLVGPGDGAPIEAGADAPPGDGASEDAPGDATAADGTADDGATDPGVDGRSCEGLPPTCGPSATESCCASVVVPAGNFLRCYDGVDFTDDNFPAAVSTFRMDRFEVTVGRFRRFVADFKTPAAGSGKNPANAPDMGWDATWTALLPQDSAGLRGAVGDCGPNGSWRDAEGSNPGTETRPITCMSWYEAFAFCIWDGGRLPTSSEWNYVATGGNEQRVYPWSVPATSGVIDATYAVYGGVDLATVGSASPKGDSRWGAADMAGNAWEWVLDFAGAMPVNCIDCAQLTPSSGRLNRGGSATWGADDLRASHTNADLPADRFPDMGFRCARAL